MPSAIGPARQALWELLLVAPGLSGAQVSFGWPDRPQPIMVALLGLTEPDEQTVLIGPDAPNEERFGLELALKSHDPAASEAEAARVDREAFEAASAIRDLIRANRTLSGTVVTCRVASQRSEGTGRPLVDKDQAATGRMCVIEMTVACVARSR